MPVGFAPGGGECVLNAHASIRDTAGFLGDVIAPTLAKGVIIRRRSMVGLAGRLDLDRRAIRRMQHLDERYGPAPLLLRMPGRPRAVMLSPDHMVRVLEESPEPFATASSEKRAALEHFQPEGVLVSRGLERFDRRRYNEAVLESGRPLHRLAERFGAVGREEVTRLLRARSCGVLDWDAFAPTWFRLVRRVVLGDGAADDEALTEQLAPLRRDANWAMLRPRRDGLRRAFLRRLGDHLGRAEPGSLAAVMAATPSGARTGPVQQVPQWLFAFDAVGMTMLRALALLATHPDEADRARQEAAGALPAGAPGVPSGSASSLADDAADPARDHP